MEIMIIHVSALDPDVAKTAAEALESDGHAILYPWWEDGDLRAPDAVASLKNAAMIGAEVLVCLDEHDPAIGFVLGWNCYTYDKHKDVIVIASECDWEHLPHVWRADDLLQARSMVFVSKSDRMRGMS